MRGRKRSTRRFAEPLSLRKTLRTFSPIPQFPQTRSPAMNFIGVDLHKKSITVCVMDQNRKVLARRTIPCTETNKIVDFFRKFRPFKVVVEATASYPWFVELVESMADEVILANPKKLRVIAESTKKTDRLDAQILAVFLVLDMIPRAYQDQEFRQDLGVQTVGIPGPGHDPPGLPAHAPAAAAQGLGSPPAVSSGPNHLGPQQGPPHPQQLQRRPQRPVLGEMRSGLFQ